MDNSEYMRNGDFLPTRLQAQQDAVNIVCHSKTRSNPENNVGLITMAKYASVCCTQTYELSDCDLRKRSFGLMQFHLSVDSVCHLIGLFWREKRK